MRKILMAVVLLAACGDGLNPAPNPNGDPCEAANSCEGGVCIVELGDGAIEFPGGVCTNECDGQTGEGCEEGLEMCLTYVPTGQSNCYQSCASSEECREEYSCTPISFFDSVCLPSEQQ